MKEMRSFPVSEQKSLRELEAVIEDGLLAFLEIGYALLEIKDRKLYRFSYRNFDVYCRVRWKMSRIHACRHIEAAKVAKILLPIDSFPQNECQVRLITSLRPNEAMDYANMCMSQLYRIREDDPERERALHEVRAWIERALSKNLQERN